MDYTYVAYTADKRLVRGKLSATNEEAATNLLSYGGYQVLSLKKVVRFFDKRKLLERFSRVKPMEIVMFSRQLALLLESGTDIVTSLQLLQAQITNPTLKIVIGEAASDIRGGSSLSAALGKHPRIFSTMYHRTLLAGEQGGNLEVVLRQMADYIQRQATTVKNVKSALTYPIIVFVVAIIVVLLLVSFVLPTFLGLYTSLGVDLPLPAMMLLGFTDWFGHYGLYLLLMIVAAVIIGFAYTRTPAGRYQWDTLLLRLPIIGRINLLDQLARCCRTMSLLFKVGLPLPEIMVIATQGTTNKAVIDAMNEVQRELIRGEGLSKPMARRWLFLPLMVQMVGVGEETGNLDNTLATVAESFEIEADDKISSAVALIQPAMTIFIGVVVAFVAVALISAMYSVYGQISF